MSTLARSKTDFYWKPSICRRTVSSPLRASFGRTMQSLQGLFGPRSSHENDLVICDRIRWEKQGAADLSHSFCCLTLQRFGIGRRPSQPAASPNPAPKNTVPRTRRCPPRRESFLRGFRGQSGRVWFAGVTESWLQNHVWFGGLAGDRWRGGHGLTRIEHGFWGWFVMARTG